CPKCSAPIRKLQAAPAFQFKGSGWYITDYAKKDSVPAGTASESSAPAKGAGKDAGSSGTGEKAGGSDATTKAPAATKPSTP
ncbi:MAG: zinc ribbon domain-containing protein, partial [Vicinamibacterales bacterium]